MAKNGTDIYLIINDYKFAYEKDASNSENSDMIETTTKHSTSKRKTFIAGESTGKITANGLYEITDAAGDIGYHALKALQLAGTAVTYEYGYQATDGVIESGSALIESINEGTPQNGVATYDISLQKTGAYSEASYSS